MATIKEHTGVLVLRLGVTCCKQDVLVVLDGMAVVNRFFWKKKRSDTNNDDEIESSTRGVEEKRSAFVCASNMNCLNLVA